MDRVTASPSRTPLTQSNPPANAGGPPHLPNGGLPALRCHFSTFVGRNASTIRLIPWRCRLWRCSRCAPTLRRRLRNLARRGHPTTFVTLTVNPHSVDSPEHAHAAMLRAWHALRQAIRRRWPNRRLEYLVVWERTKRGYPHMHILARAPWIPQRWLSARWAEYLNSPIVDIRAVRSDAEAAAYVTKYVAKQPARWGRSHCYSRSRNWDLENPPTARRAPTAPAARWTLNPYSIYLLYDALTSAGWTATAWSAAPTPSATLTAPHPPPPPAPRAPLGLRLDPALAANALP
jgi:hypothetical protein